jgi:hypothetical protein
MAEEHPTNSVAGKIALIDRGNCTFVIKVKNAQECWCHWCDHGKTMLMALITMAGNDNTITIPAVLISQDDGFFIKQQLATRGECNTWSC